MANEKRDDFILVDMRPKENFDSYHIPEAVNFTDDLTFYSEEKPKVIFYSAYKSFADDRRKILKNKFNGKIYLLSGGMKMWKEIILFPDITRMIIKDKKQIEKIVSISRYFEECLNCRNH